MKKQEINEFIEKMKEVGDVWTEMIMCQARLSPFSMTLFFPISAVMANSRSVVSGEQPNEETSFCSSVLSGFVI